MRAGTRCSKPYEDACRRRPASSVARVPSTPRFLRPCPAWPASSYGGMCSERAHVSERARELLGGVRVAPSILSAAFGRLREQVGEVIAAGARVIHVDVMDGHFVPPITIGPLVVAALAETAGDAGGMLDVHLMIERPERHVADFVD